LTRAKNGVNKLNVEKLIKIINLRYIYALQR
jgi:hypothetical protein